MKKHLHCTYVGRFMGRFVVAGLLAFSALLTACEQNSSGPTEAEGLILSGRVTAMNSAPIAGVVVALSVNGAEDTTDAQGRYELRPASAEAGAAAQDTLVFTKSGQALARINVANWVASLPDVQVVQRDISGFLTGGGTIARIEGMLTGDGINSSAPVTSDFYYNPLTNNYSGFMYFPKPTSVMNYQIRIQVYAPGGELTGVSQLVPFTSSAGNITVPLFRGSNAIPVAYAGRDTVVLPGAALQLHGSVVDSFGTTATWEWSLGGGSFVTSTTGEITFSRGTEGSYPCILRVTDNDGNQALDTVTVTVSALAAKRNRGEGIVEK